MLGDNGVRGKGINQEVRFFCTVLFLKKWNLNCPSKDEQGPGQVAQLVRASSQYTKVVGSISGQGTYRKQPMNAYISRTTNQCLSLSFENKFLKKFKEYLKKKDQQEFDIRHCPWCDGHENSQKGKGVFWFSEPHIMEDTQDAFIRLHNKYSSSLYYVCGTVSSARKRA